MRLRAIVIAVDTNVLVRLVVIDDAEQTRRAREVVAGSARIIVLYTVLSETAWVLGFTYKLTQAQVISALSSVLGLPNVSAQASERVQRAFAWAGHGMQLGDALHLSAADECEGFVSFDRDFARKADAAGAQPRVASP